MGSIVYEVDMPEVIEFKTATLSDLGAEPATERRTVAVDLRDDWATALQTAGFDPKVPAAWSAEGLLVYLPVEAQDALFDNITALSAPVVGWRSNSCRIPRFLPMSDGATITIG